MFTPPLNWIAVPLMTVDVMVPELKMLTLGVLNSPMPVPPEIVPVLVMPPRKAETCEIAMPLRLVETRLEIVPPLEMPPENVDTAKM